MNQSDIRGLVRHWRTRKDPFEEVWYDVLCWLQQEPDTTAKALTWLGHSSSEMLELYYHLHDNDS